MLEFADLAKKTEKFNYNLKVFKSFAEKFEDFHHRTIGGKGEKQSAGLMAYMALHLIDEQIAAALVNPDLEVEQAAEIILEGVQNHLIRKEYDALSPEARAELFRDAERARKKIDRRK